jgi:hypothetical protein
MRTFEQRAFRPRTKSTEGHEACTTAWCSGCSRRPLQALRKRVEDGIAFLGHLVR